MNKAEKKLTRLVNRFPELQRTDTIRDTIAFALPPLYVDTTITIRDTVTVTKDRWRVQIVNDGTNYQITGGIQPDTVYVPTETPCPTIQGTKTVYIDRPLKWHQELLYTAGQWAIGILFLWAIIAIFMRLLRSRLNRE